MPRQPRLELPGLPLHCVQRGVNRCAIFADDHDRRHYLDLLGAACDRHGVSIHAYVLMGNHVHLLLSAPAAGLVSRMMHAAGQSHVRAFNDRHARSGTLWQERFKSCLVDTDSYVLRVIRYIELNPVRAALAAVPEAYRWSSARAHLGLVCDPLLSAHAAFESLGDSAVERAQTYRKWLLEPMQPDEHDRIRRHLCQQKALGEPRFQVLVEQALNRSASLSARGRPRRVTLT